MEPAKPLIGPESVRELPTARRRLGVLLAVMHALADAPTFLEAARRALARAGDAEGWSAGVLWIAADGTDRLRCAEAWCAPGRPSIESAPTDAVISRGSGIVGRAWTAGRAIFVGDVARDEELRRDARFDREGVRAIAAIPIPLGPERGAAVAGVIELVARTPREHDALGEEIWSSVAAALGEIARRSAIEVALASAEDRLSAAEEALKRSEAQLVDADRLALLGTLAAGVAHEINNPLSYVLLNLDLVIREAVNADATQGPRSARSTDALARLREARAGVERVRLIVQDLKSFSRADTERRGPVDVRRVLDSTIEIAANEIRHRARLIRDYQDAPAVFADPSRLGQVFLNLLVNAAQALVEGEASRNDIRVSTGTDDAGRVIIEIADTGPGIPPENLERIFEPFFTTKPKGIGTGLGLSICRGIVAGLDGEITVASEVGRGTTFRIALPAIAGATSEAGDLAPLSAPASTRREPSARRRGRVLIIDDEPALATALSRSLERDYEVVVISNGRAALDRLREDDGFDVILCDLIMPHVTGMDLYDDLRVSAPVLAQRIIFMTGGSFTTRARDFLAMVDNPTLDKPFNLSTLSAMLRARTMHLDPR